MITQSNFQEVIDQLDETEIIETIEDDGDYIALSTHVFNAGYTVELESLAAYNKKYPANGNLCCDKDDFLRLLDEVDKLPEYYQ